MSCSSWQIESVSLISVSTERPKGQAEHISPRWFSHSWRQEQWLPVNITQTFLLRPLLMKNTPDGAGPWQENLCCHSTKTVQEQMEECDKEHKMPQIRILWSIWDVPARGRPTRAGLLCLKQRYESKNIHMNTRTQGFRLEHCTVATINVIHFIWQRL